MFVSSWLSLVFLMGAIDYDGRLLNEIEFGKIEMDFDIAIMPSLIMPSL